MKLQDYPGTGDSLYIQLEPEPGTETREITDGLDVDLNAAGEVVGLDIDHASTKLDFTTMEAEGLPARETRAA